MRKILTKGKRVIAFILALSMMITMLPADAVYATEIQDVEVISDTEETESVQETEDAENEGETSEVDTETEMESECATEFAGEVESEYVVETERLVDTETVPVTEAVLTETEQVEQLRNGEVSGTFNDTVSWTYVDGTLTVDGSGAVWSASEVTDVIGEYLDVVEHIVFGDTIARTAAFPFSNFTSLKTIHLGAKLTSVTVSTFASIDTLEAITVSEDNNTYKSIDGVLYSYYGNKLYCYPAASAVYKTIEHDGASYENVYEIESTVTSIESNAFYYTKNLKGVIIPAKTNSIASSAFSRWENTDIKVFFCGSEDDWEDVIENSKNGVENIFASALYNVTEICDYGYVLGESYPNALNLDYMVKALTVNVPDQRYTGEALEPEAIVKWLEYYGYYNDLILGKDYRIIYSDNVEVGTATAHVQFMRKYEGDYYTTFNIVSDWPTLTYDANTEAFLIGNLEQLQAFALLASGNISATEVGAADSYNLNAKLTNNIKLGTDSLCFASKADETPVVKLDLGGYGLISTEKNTVIIDNVDLTISNGLIQSTHVNSSEESEGTIHIISGKLLLDSCTLVEETKAASGFGAINMNDGNLVIQDTIIETEQNSYAIAAYGTGTVTVNGNSDICGGIYGEEINLVVNDGRITSKAYAVWMRKGHTVINGGLLGGYRTLLASSKDSPGLYIQQGSVEVNGGLIQGKNAGLLAKQADNVIITGGIIISDGYYYATKDSGVKYESIGLVLCDCEGTVEITGGFFRGIPAAENEKTYGIYCYDSRSESSGKITTGASTKTIESLLGEGVSYSAPTSDYYISGPVTVGNAEYVVNHYGMEVGGAYGATPMSTETIKTTVDADTDYENYVMPEYVMEISYDWIGSMHPYDNDLYEFAYGECEGNVINIYYTRRTHVAEIYADNNVEKITVQGNEYVNPKNGDAIEVIVYAEPDSTEDDLGRFEMLMGRLIDVEVTYKAGYGLEEYRNVVPDYKYEEDRENIAYSEPVKVLSQRDSELYITSYDVLGNSTLTLQRGDDEAEYITNGGKYTLDINEIDAYVDMPELKDDVAGNITDITVTSSDTSIVDVHGVLAKDSEHRLLLAPKKLGTSKITFSYKYKEKVKTISFDVEVVAEPEEFSFGYMRFDGEQEFVPFEDGEVVKKEPHQGLHIYTSVSPRLLSDIKVTVEDSTVVRLTNKLDEEFVYDETFNEAYLSSSWIIAQTQKLGTTTITMSAKYMGETYTQTITVEVGEPTGLNARSVIMSDFNLNKYALEKGRTSGIMLNSNGLLTVLALCDDNAEGINTFANKNNYMFEILDMSDEVSDKFAVEFVNDSIFYVVPLVDKLEPSDFQHKLRITAADGRTEIIMIQYFADNEGYESYNSETNELLNPITALSLVSGVEKKIYFRAYNDGSEPEFEFWHGNNSTVYGYSKAFKVVGTIGEYNIIEATLLYEGNKTNDIVIYDTFVDEYGNTLAPIFTISLLAAEKNNVPAATQQQISDFMSAADASKDIEGGIRIGDYEVALKTQEDGSKVAILVGYLGSAAEVQLPECFVVAKLVTNAIDHALSVKTYLPVIGCEDGVFDAEKGYTHPSKVNVASTYTYFGVDLFGWTTSNSTKRTEFDVWGDNVAIFAIVNGMMFVPSGESYICLDTGNVAFAPVVDGSVLLYKNRTIGRSLFGITGSRLVDDYRLSSDYLIDEDGNSTPIKVEKESDRYYLSLDSDKAGEDALTELEDGNYSMALIPTITVVINEQSYRVALPEVNCKVAVTFETMVPEVKITNSNVTVNTYLGDTCLVFFDITNSFGTAIDSIAFVDADKALTEAGVSIGQNGDGSCLLSWNGQVAPKNNKIQLEVAFGVAGYGTDGAVDAEIATQTITVNFKCIEPKTSLETPTLTFKEYPYSRQMSKMTIKDGNSTGRIDANATKIEVIGTPKGADASDISVTVEPKNSFAGWVLVNVHNNAVPGTYKVKITPALAPVRGEEERYYASAVTLIVNVKGTKPTIKFAEKLNVTLNSNFYNVTAALPEIIPENKASEPVSGIIVKNESVYVNATIKSMPKGATEGMVNLVATYGEAFDTDATYAYHYLSGVRFEASVTQTAKAGNYVFNINVPALVGGDVVWMTTTATVKVVNALPSFKLTETTVSLDASNPGMVSTVRLVMDEGYTLVRAEAVAPNVNAEACVAVDTTSAGEIAFTLDDIGLTAGGTYKVTPVVRTERGEEITLKTMNIALKVTNSSKATLSAKVKGMTINPNVGGGEITPIFTTKNLDLSEGSISEYVFTGTSTNIVGNVGTLAVEDDKIVARDWQFASNGKYTYNVVQKVTDKDGTVAYTKPFVFTVTVKDAPLTIVPEKSKITLYKGVVNNYFADDGTAYNYIYVPVSCKELSDTDVIVSLGVNPETGYNTNNSMEKQGVKTNIGYYGEGGELLLRVDYPESIKSLSKLKITPIATVVDGRGRTFNAITLNISISNNKPSIKFVQSKVTLDRLATDSVVNTVLDTEGYCITDFTELKIIKAKSSEAVQDMFELTAKGNQIEVTIKPECIDLVTNGTYIVEASPHVGVITNESDLATTYWSVSYPAISFSINITQQKPKLTVSSKNVNLYPELSAYESAYVTVIAENQTVESMKVMAPTKNVITCAEPNSQDVVRFYALAKDDGTCTYGKNVYSIEAFGKNYGGTEPVSFGTIKNAVTVNVSKLPKNLSFVSNKLTFSPYLEEKISVKLKDAEIATFIDSGNYSYEFSFEEKDSKYRTLTEEKKNDVLQITGFADGHIEITDKKLPEKSTTYYYAATIDIKYFENIVKTYTVNFPVTVNLVLPKVELYQTTVTLNNAYLNVEASNYLKLTTGRNMWAFTDPTDENAPWDVAVLSGKKDVSDYFEIDISDLGDIVIRLATELNGQVFSVPKGNYTLTVTPKVINENADIVTLSPVKLTIKVVTNKPTVKYAATKLTVNTYTNAVQQTKLTLSNGGTFVPEKSTIACTKYPNKNITSADGIIVALAADGTLSAVAGRNAKAGTYTYTVTPVTRIDGCYVVLDAKTISVVVQNTMPTVVLSTAKVTLNSLFADEYNQTISVTAKNAGDYAYDFTKDAIAFAEPKAKATKKEDAAALLNNMVVTMNPDGTASITVNLPVNHAVANGTYKFNLTPSILTGDEKEADDKYTLKAVSFGVVVENKKPTVSAKVSGTIDLVNRENGITVQLAFNKQNYETLENISKVQLVDKKTGAAVSEFRINEVESDFSLGKVYIRTYNGYDLAANKTYSYKLVVTTSSGQNYETAVNIKTTQTNYKVISVATNFYTEINNAQLVLNVTNDVSVEQVKLVKITSDAKGKKNVAGAMDNFNYKLHRQDVNYIELWTRDELAEDMKGKTLYFTFQVTPHGLATNKQPVTVTIPVTIK